MMDIFEKSGFSEIWIFGYVENAPRHIPTFQFSDFEILRNQHCCKTCPTVWLYLPFPSGVVSLRGIQNQGFDFLSMESPLSEVNPMTEVPGNSVSGFIEN